jgi:hypothetical protein
MEHMRTPAEKLLGLDLDGGWKVVEAVERSPESTGGNFSRGYLVERADGTRGYLKALDLLRAMGEDDPAAVLQAMTEAFNFERRICERCSGEKPVNLRQQSICDLRLNDLFLHGFISNSILCGMAHPEQTGVPSSLWFMRIKKASGGSGSLGLLCEGFTVTLNPSTEVSRKLR